MGIISNFAIAVERPPYVEEHIDLPIDHTVEHSASWAGRYFLCDKWYRTGGPIFFYAGHEAPLEVFYSATEAMFQAAPKFNAVLVFSEHRYYGKSLPFGNQSFEVQNIRHLNVRQALADYAMMLRNLRGKYVD